MLFKASLLAAAATLAAAQTTESICDKYTTAVFKTNNATNQLLLLTYLVNTALVGNFTPAPTGSMVAVQGILNPAGTYMGETVNLVPYFDGGLASTNVDGAPGAMNFLDDGGAAPLMALMPANGTTSNQYFLVTHLYSYFGALLGCSEYGMTGYPAYSGDNSQYNVHKYMDLNAMQINYFIQEVGLAAASFGVTTADITTVANALNSTFNYKCAPAVNVTSTAVDLQAICIDPSCPLAANASCSGYDAVLAPIVANASLAMGEGVSSTVTLAASGATSGIAGASMTSGASMTTGSSMTGSSMTGSSSMMTGSMTSATAAATSSSFAYQTAAPVLGALMAAGAFVLAM